MSNHRFRERSKLIVIRSNFYSLHFLASIQRRKLYYDQAYIQVEAKIEFFSYFLSVSAKLFPKEKQSDIISQDLFTK